jgi:hypothetical protein
MKEPLIAVPCNAGAQLAMKYAGQELDIGKTLASFFLLGEELSYQKLASWPASALSSPASRY